MHWTQIEPCLLPTTNPSFSTNVHCTGQPGNQDYQNNWQTIYSAAYQAALAHQQAFTNNMLIQNGQGPFAHQVMGQMMPQHAQSAANIANTLAANPGMLNPAVLGSQNASAAAAAAATMAVQNLIAGGHPILSDFVTASEV